MIEMKDYRKTKEKRYPNSNPMKDLDENTKYGDILQPNAHDALAKKGKMGILDSFGACQTLSLKTMAKMGVTCIDVRVKKDKKGIWHGYHGITESKDNALTELRQFIGEVVNNPETIYTIKLKVSKDKYEEFLLDFIKYTGVVNGKSLGNIILNPINAKTKELQKLSLSEIRKTGRNLIIIIPEKNIKGVAKDICWVGNHITTYSQEQSTTKTNEELVQKTKEKIAKIRNDKNDKLIGSTPAHTLSTEGILKGTSFFFPLNDAKKNKKEIVNQMLKEGEINKGDLQYLGLNGIGGSKQNLYKDEEVSKIWEKNKKWGKKTEKRIK